MSGAQFVMDQAAMVLASFDPYKSHPVALCCLSDALSVSNSNIYTSMKGSHSFGKHYQHSKAVPQGTHSQFVSMRLAFTKGASWLLLVKDVPQV